METSRLFLDSVLERAQLGGDGFDCFCEGRSHRLQLWGHLPPGWAGNLSLHTYASGLRILSGTAVRVRGGTWAATLLLRTEEPGSRLRHDFLNMARRGPRLLPLLPDLDVAFESKASRDQPGSVYVRVTGADSMGLLAEVLRRFARLRLQPRRFVLSTEGDRVADWFWLEPLRATRGAHLSP